ncbi:MAG TPA: hypothetical protein VHY30_06130 [Verrucomicrobiae bacterium]|jgi:hypothetical protein|nr:hypothetical protein [Verrucomicrobiae bacterium]
MKINLNVVLIGVTLTPLLKLDIEPPNIQSPQKHDLLFARDYSQFPNQEHNHQEPEGGHYYSALSPASVTGGAKWNSLSPKM